MLQQSSHSIAVRAVLAALLCGCFAVPAEAQEKRRRPNKKEPAAEAPRIEEYTSPHFLLRTDLPAADAAELLERLETMLGLVSDYWQRPPQGTIECNVVKDASLWTSDLLAPADRALIEGGGGITHTLTVTSRNRKASKAVVFAGADHGTPQHEAVHAYCGQTFHRVGPVWYSEGMAEMGQYWRKNELAVRCDPLVVRYIRQARPRTMLEIVNGKQISGDSWQEYSWRWALCHVLEHNPNYRQRFRALGLGLLNGQEVSFEEVFGPVADEISFEYDFFLQHFDVGYRVDLCVWDWKKKCRGLSASQTRKLEVQAGRGWQSSGCLLNAGQRYAFKTEGKCRYAKDGPEMDADGDAAGRGRLVGVVQDGFELSEPFDLGHEGEFDAPGAGKLFLRCRDDWGQLADNQGKLTLRLSRADAGKNASDGDAADGQ